MVSPVFYLTVGQTPLTAASRRSPARRPRRSESSTVIQLVSIGYFSYHVRTRLIQCTNIACIWDVKLHLCKTVRGVKQMILIYNEKFTVQGTGVLACKWRNCGREFTEKKYLVDHVTSSHIEQRKGCDDFPCFWEVISLFLVNIVYLSLTLTLIKPPTILSVFFSTCAVMLNDYDADMSSSVETVQCEV